MRTTPITEPNSFTIHDLGYSNEELENEIKKMEEERKIMFNTPSYYCSCIGPCQGGYNCA